VIRKRVLGSPARARSTPSPPGKKDATTAGKYHKGMAVFTIVKGGAMYEMSVAGQKFSYKPIAAKKSLSSSRGS